MTNTMKWKTDHGRQYVHYLTSMCLVVTDIKRTDGVDISKTDVRGLLFAVVTTFQQTGVFSVTVCRV